MRNDAHPWLNKPFFGWLHKQARFFFLKHGPPPEEEELLAEGFLVVYQYMDTYEPGLGSPESYCWKRTIGQWRRLLDRERREVPIGAWSETLSCLPMVPLSLNDGTSRDGHAQRLTQLVDTTLAADMLCVEDAMIEKLDRARAMAALNALPANDAEPGRTLLLAVCHGDTLSNACRTQKIKRHVGRVAVKRLLERLATALLDERGTP